MGAYELNVPLSENDVRNLNVGDVVYLTGPVFTGMSLFHIRTLQRNMKPPVNYSNANVLVHTGPLMKQDNEEWRPIGIDPTSSLYMDKYGPEIIRELGLRAIVGKTTMGRESMLAMREYGCVHLTIAGVMGNILARQTQKVLAVHGLEELGPNDATWVLEFELAGPFIVGIDTHGRNLVHEQREALERNFEEYHKRFDLIGFDFIDVNV